MSAGEFEGQLAVVTGAAGGIGAAIATALAAGEQDVILLDFMTLPQSLEKGVLKDIKLIENVKLDGHPDYRGNVFRVMANSGINTAADLKGKTVSTVTIGQSIDFAFRVWAKKGGVDPDRDVKIVEMPFTAVGPALPTFCWESLMLSSAQLIASGSSPQ